MSVCFYLVCRRFINLCTIHFQVLTHHFMTGRKWPTLYCISATFHRPFQAPVPISEKKNNASGDSKSLWNNKADVTTIFAYIAETRVIFKRLSNKAMKLQCLWQVKVTPSRATSSHKIILPGTMNSVLFSRVCLGFRLIRQEAPISLLIYPA